MDSVFQALREWVREVRLTLDSKTAEAVIDRELAAIKGSPAN